MLNEKLWPIMSKRGDCTDFYFQQDGTPAHYAVSIEMYRPLIASFVFC